MGATEYFINGVVCRRVLDWVIDGRKDREGCEERDEPCSVCQRQSELVDRDDVGIAEDEEETRVQEREAF